MNQWSLCLANSWQKTISLTALRWARLKEAFGFYRNYGGASVALYSDEGLTLQTSALQLFYSGNLTLVNSCYDFVFIAVINATNLVTQDSLKKSRLEQESNP